jgi:SAM-dependent methyltransferase
MIESPFWEEQEQVERFAAREPDHRLLALVERYEDPSATRVLDIGCAGGRNVELLASRGFDVFAVDISAAMVRRTRERAAAVFGEEEARRRVRRATMEDLSEFETGDFDLVVALGVFHVATTGKQWHNALSEAARVLAPGGIMLVSVFSNKTNPTGKGITPVEGEPNIYEGLRSGRHYLVGPEALDAEMARRGLMPVEKTDTVVVPLESGQRVTINAVYRKGE